MQLRGRASGKTKRHGELRAPFAFVRFGRSGSAFVLSARPATAAGCFTTFSSRYSCLFAREFVRGSFLVGGTPTLGSDRALRLGIHRRESARSLSTRAARIPRLHSAVSSRAAYGGAISAPRSVAASASLVHHIPVVVGLVCHYPSPPQIFELARAAARLPSLRVTKWPKHWPRLHEDSGA
jgi:hypothetical protein